MNDNLFKLIKNIITENFIDTIKALKLKYGVSYTVSAKACRMSTATLNTMIYRNFVSYRIAGEACTAIKEFYLGRDYKTFLDLV